MIPANLDYRQILADLNGWGVRDYKIEAICALSVGHLAKIKCGATKDMVYPNAARLYNFWLDERERHEEDASRETSSFQPLVATTF